MFEALGEWMSYPLYYAHFGGAAPARTGPDHATIVPYGGYRAGDGKNVMLGLQNEREWAAFCDKVLGQPALATDPRYDSNAKRNSRRAEIVGMIENAFSKLTAEQVVAKLDIAGIANARINTPEEVWDHPQFKARSRWREMGSPVGPLPTPLPPATISGFEARIDAVPGVGEHTDTILGEVGYSGANIAALRAAGAI
jgi:itaconate CoA-transferase